MRSSFTLIIIDHTLDRHTLFYGLKRGKKGPKMVLKSTKKSIENPTGLLRGGGVRGLSSQGLLKVNISFLLPSLT